MLLIYRDKRPRMNYMSANRQELGGVSGTFTPKTPLHFFNKTIFLLSLIFSFISSSDCPHKDIQKVKPLNHVHM